MPMKKPPVSYRQVRALSGLPLAEPVQPEQPDGVKPVEANPADASQTSVSGRDAPAGETARSEPLAGSGSALRRGDAQAPDPDAPEPETAYLRFRARHPTPGTCAEYDEIQHLYDRKTAMRTLLERAFAVFIELGPQGGEVPMGLTYEAADDVEPYETTRSIPQPVYKAYRERLDPLGVRSRYFLGHTIGTIALARYIAKSKEKAAQGDEDAQ